MKEMNRKELVEKRRKLQVKIPMGIATEGRSVEENFKILFKIYDIEIKLLNGKFDDD